MFVVCMSFVYLGCNSTEKALQLLVPNCGCPVGTNSFTVLPGRTSFKYDRSASDMAPTDIAAFATTQLDLLDRELKAELEETSELSSQYAPAGLQRAGLAVLNLQLGSQRTGFGGKTIVDLEHDSAIGQADLPEHGFRPGDIVGVRPQVGGSVKKREKAEADKKGVDGVVVKTTSSSVAVALDKDEVDIPSGKLWM